MDHGWHKLSENIWFVWSKRSYSGDKRGCHACGRTTNNGRNVKIELEFWEAEFAILTPFVKEKYLKDQLEEVNRRIPLESPH